MRPSDDVPRLLECGNAMLLVAKASHLATRVYLTLFWGDGSEKPGIGRCGPGELADVLQSSRRAIVAALDELKSLGLIAWSESERLAYRPGFALRFNPDNYITHTNWRNTAERLRDGVIRAQVLADIGPQRPPPALRGAALRSPLPAPLLSASSASSASSLDEEAQVAAAPSPASPAARPDGTEGKQEALALAPAPSPSSAPPLPAKGKQRPPLPEHAIVDAWNRQTEGVRPRATIAGQTKTILAQRWRDHPDAAWWDSLFAAHVASRNSWTGAFLEWALRDKQFDAFAFNAFPPTRPIAADNLRNGDNY